jgi:hypothetical protein
VDWRLRLGRVGTIEMGLGVGEKVVLQEWAVACWAMRP